MSVVSFASAARASSMRSVPLVLCAMAVTAAAVWPLGGGSYVGVVAVAAAAALAACVARPRAAVLLVILLGCTVFSTGALGFSLAGVRSDPTEAIVLVLVGLALLRWRGFLPEGRVLFGPLLLLVAAAAVGCLVAMANGASLSLMLGPFKTSLVYLFAIPVGALFASAADRALLERWLLRIATVASCWVLVVHASGFSQTSGTTEDVFTLGTTVETQRLRPALLALLVLVTLLVVARIAVEGATPRLLACLGLFSLVLLLSYTRSTWVPLLMSCVALALLHPGARRPTRGVRTALVAAVVVAVLTVSAAAGWFGARGEALLLRVQSIGTTAVREDRTYVDRAEENEAALEAIQESPVLGVGVRQPYGLQRVVYLPNPPRLVRFDQTFIHNSYLGAWLQLGLLGLAALGAIAFRVTREALRARRELPPADAARCLAGALAVLTYGLSALFATVLLHRPSILALTLAAVFAHRPVQEPQRT